MIIMAKSAGFCFGVKRAIKLSLNAAAHGKISSLGPLIHNPREVRRLEELGIIPIDKVEDIPAGVVIIRSHGVAPQVMEELKAKNLNIIDATCPFVQKAQSIAVDLQKECGSVVVVGNRDHPEIRGILGFLNNDAIVVNSLVEAKERVYPDKVGIMSQTTQSLANFRAIVEYIQGVVPQVVVCNTICKATAERQKEASDLAATVDVMLVIGGKNSANTKRLAEIAAESGAETFIIEDAKEIDTVKFKINNLEAKKIGLTAGASTPDWIIEEVMEKMKEDNVMEEKNLEVENVEETMEKVEEVAEEPVAQAEAAVEDAAASQGEASEEVVAPQEEAVEEEETMAASYAAFDKECAVIRRGERLKGTIIKVTDSEVMVDIGGKSEGVIPKNEFTPSEAEQLTELFHEGDEVEVLVLRRENEDGHPILSKKKVDVDIAWDKLAQAMEDGEVLEGKVLDVVKGGLLVDIGLKGFVPASLVELGFVNQLDKYKDQIIQFKVLECDKNHNKLILSRKAFLEMEKAKKREKVWAEIEEGQTRHGVVQRITNFGAFVDLDGVDGLLHVSQMAWYRVNHPSEILSIGDEIDVYVLTVDSENQKISLGLKQLIPNPWSTVPDKYPLDAIVEAKVVRTAAFGAFVQLEPGVEGLVHISQLSWSHVDKTEDAVAPGDIVNVKVLGFDLDSKKISLSIKETTERPKPEDAPAKEEPQAEEEHAYAPDDDVVTIGDMVHEAEEN
ncbi:MAG: bifunctional 4-hydroxy-3-methylbut-2-enyl diphosphate reductase/30S ribosomal protein S1 [Bacillota bacterium]|nr:bifunctional 4-hydroxy-3-methylbut-2-enyl diphosphate reductase/30S ribosomal protein S1 [Bacillota bacterium]